MNISPALFAFILLSSQALVLDALDVNAAFYAVTVQVNTGVSVFNEFAVSAAPSPADATTNIPAGATQHASPCDTSLYAGSKFTNTYPCASNSTCTVIASSVFQCRCNNGFNQTASTTTFTPASTGVTVTPDGTNCPDIDECASGAPLCGVGACVNTIGSYTCNCPGGYTLNMTTLICDDDDECTLGTHTCNANAVCVNTPGSFTCTCNLGYSGDGFTCTDFDVCSHVGPSICGGTAAGTCVDQTGSYNCTCNVGYVLDIVSNPTCNDVDECATGTHTCDPTLATCNNTIGGHTCACIAGYTGTGTTGNCADIDECLTSPCDTNAACANNVGSFTCTCNAPSFVGDGITCSGLVLNIDFRAELVTGEDASSLTVASQQSAVATVIKNILDELVSTTTFGYNATGLTVTLEQLSGNTTSTTYIVVIDVIGSTDNNVGLQGRFSGTSFSSMINGKPVTSIEDFDECEVNYGNCSTNAICTNNDGGFECVCNDTHADRSPAGQANGTVCELPTAFNCTQNAIELRTYIPYFVNHNIDVSKLTLGSCLGTTMGDYHVFSGTCDPVVTSTASILTYSWNLTNINNSASFVFGKFANIPIQCNFPASINVTLSINATRSEVAQPSVSIGIGVNVDFEVKPFFDAGLNNAIAGPISTDTSIFARIGSSTSLASNVKLIVDRIQAAASDNSDSVELVSGGCVSQDPSLSGLSNLVSLLKQGTSSQALVQVPALFFPSGSSSTIYSFEVSTCVETGGIVCAPSCGAIGRRKRATVIMRLRRNEDSQHGEAQFAIVRALGDETCRKDCGEGVCVVNRNAVEREVCWCSKGTRKTSEGKCVKEEIVIPNTGTGTVSQQEDRTTLYVLIGLGSLVLILIIGLLVAFFCRKRASNQKNYELDHVNTHAIDS
uniref:latent-transforming growth factor beta-binding protein 1 n=1 Tax=Ciona intestinalis TaxID=7719 RepID=UPI000180D1FC|nr:latent-transforming growth factor beta-binding protein 1 [Ciona intestinalis]|eukprot:XP_018668134.1 latent-transforming growth factor beta-binding protein 1 [Ciona intestinalis]